MPANGPIITDDAGDPVRQSQGANPGGFTGGGGGGGISSLGGGASFQGFGPQATSQPGFGAAKRRFYTMADQTQQMPGANATSGVNFASGGSVSGGPPGVDTVNAHLNNGEFVVNRNAAQNPDNAMELERMNGGPGVNGGPGGQGSPPMDSGMSPGLSREALVELLHVLLSDEQDFCYGGRMNSYKLGGWVGNHKWAIPAAAILAAVTAPLWVPAAGAALGIGGGAAASGASGGALAGSGAMAAGDIPAATGAAAGSGAGFLTGHPALAMALHAGKAAAPLGFEGYQQHQGQVAGRRAQQDQDSEIALNNYRNARMMDEAPGMASGGWWGGRQPWGGMRSNVNVKPAAGGPIANPMQPAPQVAPQPAPQATGTPWATPGALSGMQEAGAMDANNYASGVYRNAVLSGADPGAAASYKLSALASAGRGSAEALSKYRTGYASDETNRLYELEKQRRDEYYQEKLKRIH